MNKLLSLHLTKYFVLLPLVIILFLSCKEDVNGKDDKPLDDKNSLTSLVLTLSGKEEFIVDIDKSTENSKLRKATVSVPYETKLDELKVKTLRISTLATCSIMEGQHITLGVDKKSFKIVVTAQNGSEAVYTISINKLPRKGKDMTVFKLFILHNAHLTEDIITFNVNQTTRQITGTVKLTSLDSNVLKPAFDFSDGATVKVNDVEQTSGESEQDFTNPVIYKIIPEDTNETPKEYTVVVNFEYDKLSVSTAGELKQKTYSNTVSGNLALAHKMNGQIVKSIGEGAFKDCKSLTGSLNLPNTIESIGKNAFQDAGFTGGTLYIPSSVTTIGENAFRGTGFTELCNKSTATPGKDAFTGMTASISCK